MTPKYWARIVAGMLVVFVLGMFAERGIDKARSMVLNHFPLLNASFRVDGENMGVIQRLQFMRSAPGRVDSAVVTVKLAADASQQRFDGCILRINHAEPFGSRTRFICTSSSDSARLGLAPFGHVVLQPEGKEVKMYLANDVLQDVQAGAYRGTGAKDSGDVDIQSANGNYTITVNGKVLVQASGDSAGGSLVLRRADGQPILEFHGDSAGGSVKITDANGKTRVNIHGGNTAKP